MAITRSWTETAPAVVAVGKRLRRRGDFFWLLGASLLVAAGLGSVYAGKLATLNTAEILVNLNTIQGPEDLLPLLDAYPDREERERTAQHVMEFLDTSRPLQNVGALSRLRPRLPLTKLKPLLMVRTPREFRVELLRWSGLYFAGFYLVAFVWRRTRFTGDRSFLPALHLLSGIGFILMTSMRDPLRDTLEFHKFAIGTFLGCLLLALPAIKPLHYQRLSDWCYTPLFLALSLFGLLMAFGRGPAGNDAKVNLGPFQPVEAIKILLVIFLAGYFTRNWERLRDLRLKKFDVPRVEHVLPVLVAVGVSLVFFFVLKDLGPALVIFFVFLAMFSVARGRAGLALAGLVLMVASVAIGYRLGQPHTVVQRIDMWLAPWDNDVHGGDQLAHALWAFSTGGPYGSGPGWGDPAMIPAGNTDLVLPAIGEEWGFAGVATVFLLIGYLIARSLRAAWDAETHFGFFLGLGLASLIAFEMILISAGVLGLLPLSGVVSPFLSSGNTAMLANFAIFALLLSISAERREEGPHDLLQVPARRLGAVLACVCVALLAMAARYQVLRDSDYLARDANAFEQDGVKRPQHNPRMNSMAREIPRGTIYDRNGIPLATSDWPELQHHRADFEALGVTLEDTTSRFDNRHYPFGAMTAHLVGDLRTGENFHASNASLVEHDFHQKLQGYEYAELAPLVRNRHAPNNPAIARILARDRNIRLTIDVRLQAKAQEVLERRLKETEQQKGALVVMDSISGGVLAMVSAPAPVPPAKRTAAPSNDELLDRARYGLYPPGSTFKLVTAIAALNTDSKLRRKTFHCGSVGDGRAGTWIPGWNRAIKDDVGDHSHGTLDMERAIAVSCNAYFAQLGVACVGSKALAETAASMGISTGDPKELRRALPFAAYGQGPVLISPFKMARVSAAIAAGGLMPQGRWVEGDDDSRSAPPVSVVAPADAAFLAHAMRRVVTEGTARHAMDGSDVSFAGKTGTAQLDEGMPHSWFTGFAPYDGDASKRIAFAVIVEHGGYGARVAAPIARQVM